MTKIITLYLPQFHIVEENEKWWGKGFTEWTTVKNAKPLKEGHLQPRIPLNNNYYNLLDKETMIWQAELMKKYGVYGQCFYHYYFKDGKQILEKPAENLLKWKDIDMPFCFSWANESWVTSWTNIRGGNAWAEQYESIDRSDCKSGVLLEQNYGGKDEWEKHFFYLLPFFKDERYIKVNDKPVFMIYKPQDITCIEEMINTWRCLAKKNGFQDLFLIGANYNPDNIFDAMVITEPASTFSDVAFMNNSYVSKVIDADKLSENIVQRMTGEKVLYCSTVGYDNSPRKGRNAAVVENMTPEIFYKQIQSLLSLSKKTNKEFVFINAWNEWGEGMYLEPDELYGYGFLEAVKKAIENSDKEPEIKVDPINQAQEELAKCKEKVEKYRQYWNVLDKWMSVLEKGIGLEEYFSNNGLKNIAIYGYGMIGKHFVEQIRNTDVKIDYIIDLKADIMTSDIPVFSLKENILPDVDLIVICVTYGQKDIMNELRKRTDSPMITIEEVVGKLKEIKSRFA